MFSLHLENRNYSVQSLIVKASYASTPSEMLSCEILLTKVFLAKVIKFY